MKCLDSVKEWRTSILTNACSWVEVVMDIQYFVLEAQVLIKIAGIVFFVGHHFWHQPVEAGEKKMSWDVFHIQFLSLSTYFQRSFTEAMKKGIVGYRWRWLLSAERTSSSYRPQQNSHRYPTGNPVSVCLWLRRQLHDSTGIKHVRLGN